jgi:type VI secretion system secreted protein VgrG
LGRPFEYQVDLLSKTANLDLADVLGKPMTVILPIGMAGRRHFNGVIARFWQLGWQGEETRYRATLRPWLWLLTRTSNCRIFQHDKTVPDIVKETFRYHQITDFDDSRLTADRYRKWDYLVQYRETDFNFVSRIMEQEGIYYYFRHEADKHILVLADSYSAHDAAAGYETVPHQSEGRATAGSDRQEGIDGWAFWRQVQPGSFVADDFDFENPRGDRLSSASFPQGKTNANFEIYDYPGEFKDRTQGEAQARVRLEELQLDYEQFEGGGTARGLAAGGLFTLTGHPRDDLDREYLIISASYALTGNLHISGAGPDGEPDYRCNLVTIDAQRPFRTPATTPKPAVQGPQTAIVVGKAGEEIWTDAYGRVKVQFHWDRFGAADEDSSCWVRVAQVWAGANWGAMHIPRIGQEVLVDFLEGDPDRPIITGRVYNKDNMPPYALPDNKTQSGIKSRSSSGGAPNNYNEIRFEDSKGAEELHIQAEKDQSTHVKHNQSISVDADRGVTVGGNETITVSGTRTTAVKKKDVQTYGDAQVVSVKLTEDLTVGEKLTETFKGGRDTTVEKFDNTTVKSANKNINVDQQYNLDAQEHISLVQKGTQIFVKDKVYVESIGDIELKNKGCDVLAENAGTLTLKAKQQIQIQCGAATITLKMDGSIVLDGITGIQATSGPTSLKLGPDGATTQGPKVGVTGMSLVEVTAPVIKVG